MGLKLANKDNTKKNLLLMHLLILLFGHAVLLLSINSTKTFLINAEA